MRLITVHFWIATIGVVLYITSMWIAGVMQGLMWRATNSDGTLTYAFVESGQGDLSVLRDSPARRRRCSSPACCSWRGTSCARCGRQGSRSASIAARCRRRSPVARPRTEGSAMKFTHEAIEKNVGWMIVLIVLVVAVGGLVEIVPLYFQKSTDRAGRRRQAVYAAATRGSRRLPARRLLQLPFADDPAVPRGDRALRSLLGRRRIGVRPPVPVGQQAHRARSRARRRAAIRTTGTASICNNPRDVVPESNMPGYPWFAKTRAERR